MALQLVYTSAPKLLDAGRSGFGVVARSKSLPPLAANAIERFSKYANMQGTDRSRIVMAHRKVTIGSSRFHVLTRIRDCGSDHTGRTNHIAHHLIFSPLEVRQADEQRLTPADIFAQFAWLDRWEGAPKAFDGSAGVQIGSFLPNYSATHRTAWAAATGDPIHSRLLAWDGAPRSGALIVPADIKLLPLLGEALAECQNPWEKTFTTSLEPTDELAELDWVIVSRSNTSAISRLSSRTVFDILRPLDLPVPTEAPLSKPDINAAAGREGSAPATQKRVVPPPDLTPRPIQARIIPADVSGGAPRENREATVVTGGAGSGKLWMIIGGGIAALCLLIAMVLVLVKTQAESPQTAEAAKEEKAASLVAQLVNAGERESEAKTIAKRPVDPSVLKALPEEMLRLKESLIALGKKESAEKGLEIFINNNKDIEHREFFPKSSLCHVLWESKLWIRQLHGEGDTTRPSKTAGKLLGELKLSLENGSKLTDPEWLKQEEIDQIYLILWEWKYPSLVENLLKVPSTVTVSNLEEFMADRDVTLISDATVEEIYKRLDEDKLNNYVEKVTAEKNPELLAKLLLLSPPVTENKDNAVVTAPDKDSENPEPMTKSQVEDSPALENEEWCYAGFKPEEKGFTITLPDSEILKRIAKVNDLSKVEFFFGDKKRIKVNENDYSDAGKMIAFDGIKITCTRESKLIDISSPLTICYQESELVIYLGKWPDDKIKETGLSGKFTRIPPKGKGAATYTLVLKGAGIKDIWTLKSKTISGEGLVLVLADKYRGVFSSDNDTLEIKGIPPGSGNLEPPSEAVKKAFQEAISKTNAKKTDLENENKKKNLGKLSDNEIHKKAWEDGWNHLKSVLEAHEWLKKKYKSEHPNELPMISQISGEMDQNSKNVLAILENPKGKSVEPSNRNILIKIMVGKHIAYKKTFTIELEE